MGAGVMAAMMKSRHFNPIVRNLALEIERLRRETHAEFLRAVWSGEWP